MAEGVGAEHWELRFPLCPVDDFPHTVVGHGHTILGTAKQGGFGSACLVPGPLNGLSTPPWTRMRVSGD